MRLSIRPVALALVALLTATVTSVFAANATPTVTPANPALANFAPGTWFEAPNSHLADVQPTPHAPGNIGGVIGAWSGGCYDTKRERLLVWGGGHGDYAGNEIYAFDLNTLQWSIAWGPTPNEKISDIKLGKDPYDDGNPASRHTYDELEYLPDQDQFFSCNGGIWSGGRSSNHTWILDFATNKWMAKADVPEACHTQSAYDPVTKHMFLQLNIAFVEYDPAKDSYTQRGKVGGGVWKTNNGVIDPERRLFVTVGAKSIACWNLKTFERTTPKTTGDNELENEPAPGLEYDPTLKKFVAWNGGTAVYILDPDTWHWTKLDAAPANKVTPTAATKAGIYGRWRYIPSQDLYIGVNGVKENVFFFKRGSLPPASNSAPSDAPVTPAVPPAAPSAKGTTGALPVAKSGTSAAPLPPAARSMLAPAPAARPGRTGLAAGAKPLPAPALAPAGLELNEEDTSTAAAR